MHTQLMCAASVRIEAEFGFVAKYAYHFIIGNRLFTILKINYLARMVVWIGHQWQRDCAARFFDNAANNRHVCFIDFALLKLSAQFIENHFVACEHQQSRRIHIEPMAKIRFAKPLSYNIFRRRTVRFAVNAQHTCRFVDYNNAIVNVNIFKWLIVNRFVSDGERIWRIVQAAQHKIENRLAFAVASGIMMKMMTILMQLV